MLVRSRYRLRSGTMPSLGGQRRIYKERASWNDLPEYCGGSSTFIANSEHLRRQVGQRRNSLPVIFLHQEGGSCLPIRAMMSAGMARGPGYRRTTSVGFGHLVLRGGMMPDAPETTGDKKLSLVDTGR